ncbi:MAG: hypothetical protein HY716_01770 [Planctomycetes bacterium]|nr:hypothetical protein [Planctomycetota bacterium]
MSCFEIQLRAWLDRESEPTDVEAITPDHLFRFVTSPAGQVRPDGKQRKPSSVDKLKWRPAPPRSRKLPDQGRPIGRSRDDFPAVGTERDGHKELIPLGFSFEFYGYTYTDCYMNTNAFVKFGSSTVPGPSAYDNGSIPTAGGDENKICVKGRGTLWIGRARITAADRWAVASAKEEERSIATPLYARTKDILLVKRVMDHRHVTTTEKYAGTADRGFFQSF